MKNKNKNKNHIVTVKGLHHFADDFLTSIQFQLKHAEKIKDKHFVYIYTLPIIIMTISFLESSINFLISSFSMPNNIIKDFKKGLEIDKLNKNNTVIYKNDLLEKYKLVLKKYKNDIIKNDKEYQKIPDIIKLRNAIVHDKLINCEQEIIQVLKKLEKYQDFKLDDNIKDIVSPRTIYFGYTPTCWIVKSVFNFHIKYMKTLLGEEYIPYENKINDILKQITP